MAISLPTSSVKPTTVDPTVLTILSNTKVGKTSSGLQLPNSLLIDLEDSTGFYEGTYLNLKKQSAVEGKGLGALLLETATAIQQANTEAGRPVYDFIIIDTLTVIEQIARQKATYDYKKTLAGKNFTGSDVVAELAKGAGYVHFQKAFNDLINPFKGLAGKCLVLYCHAKLSSITKDSTELDIKDIELSGKNKLAVTAFVDSIGLLYRHKKNKNQNIMTFKTSDDNLVCGSRSPHLRNKTFVFSEYNPTTDVLTTHWDLIFKSLGSDKQMEEIVEDVQPVLVEA